MKLKLAEHHSQIKVAGLQHPTRIVRVLRKSTRNNLPRASAGKRGESNFVLAFGRAYLKAFGCIKRAGSFLPAREFQVSGFGVADFVWYAWRLSPHSREGAAVHYRAPHRVQTESLLAFEMKLRDWRRALGQAYRYRYFADGAYVVLPAEVVATAQAHLEVFRKMEVGLWSFDQKSEVIRKIYSPRRQKPLSSKARARAVALLSRFVKAGPIPGTV